MKRSGRLEPRHASKVDKAPDFGLGNLPTDMHRCLRDLPVTIVRGGTATRTLGGVRGVTAVP